MEIDYDLAKDTINRAKHGVSLAFGERLFADLAAIVFEAERPQDGEPRRKIVGRVGDRLWTAIYVERGSKTRFISVRRSNDAECRGYHRHTGRSG